MQNHQSGLPADESHGCAGVLGMSGPWVGSIQSGTTPVRVNLRNMGISMAARRSMGREFLVNEISGPDLNNFLRIAGNNIKNAQNMGLIHMTLTWKCFRPIARSMAGAALIITLGACSLSIGEIKRPAALAQIKPSKGPVRQAAIHAPAKIERFDEKPVRFRPLNNLPRPLLAKVTTPEKRLQCVPYARQLSNIQIRGNAWTWWAQAEGRYDRSADPKAGSVMVLKRKETSGSLGHVAFVNEVIDSRMIIVSHANWLNEGRLHDYAPVLDVSKDNDWSEVRFWHTPGKHFGGSIYKPYGFILPHQMMASR